MMAFNLMKTYIFYLTLRAQSRVAGILALY